MRRATKGAKKGEGGEREGGRQLSSPIILNQGISKVVLKKGGGLGGVQVLDWRMLNAQFRVHRSV